MFCGWAPKSKSPKISELRRRPNRPPAPVHCSWPTIPWENAAEKFWRSKPRHEARRTAACRSTSNPFLAASASGIALLPVASWLIGESLPQSTRLEELFLILDASPSLSLDLLLQRWGGLTGVWCSWKAELRGSEDEQQIQGWQREGCLRWCRAALTSLLIFRILLLIFSDGYATCYMRVITQHHLLTGNKTYYLLARALSL